MKFGELKEEHFEGCEHRIVVCQLTTSDTSTNNHDDDGTDTLQGVDNTDDDTHNPILCNVCLSRVGTTQTTTEQ